MPSKKEKPSEIKIVLLHGWGGSSESFKQLSQTLSQSLTIPVDQFICPDLPGFGQCPTKPQPNWNTQDYADWLDTQWKSWGIDPYQDQVVLYGHSFGCRVIIRWCLKHPQFKGKVILTGAAGIKWPPTLKQKIMQALVLLLKPFKSLQNNIKPQTFLGKIKRRIFRLLGARDWLEANPTMKSVLQNVLKEEDLRSYLSQIQNPVLLLWGQKDTYTPLKSAHIFAQELPHNQLIVFPDGRHGIHYTHSEEITKLTKHFLEK